MFFFLSTNLNDGPPGCPFNFKHMEFSYSKVDINLLGPNNMIEVDVNFTFDQHAWDGSLEIDFELNYSYNGENNVQKINVSHDDGVGTFKLYINPPKNNVLSMNFDLHHYVFCNVNGQTYRYGSKDKDIELNLSNYLNLGNINVGQNNNYDIIVPTEFEIDPNNNFHILEQSSILVQSLIILDDRKSYIESSIVDLTFKNGLLANFFNFNIYKPFLKGSAYYKDSEVNVEKRQEAPNKIEYYFNSQTYYDPILGKVCVGHSAKYHNFNGLLLPWWSDSNFYIQLPFISSSFVQFHFIIFENLHLKDNFLFKILFSNSKPANPWMKRQGDIYENNSN